jgi:hypothetical protein
MREALAARTSQLRACADREEDITRRVEALYSDAGAIQHAMLAKNPDFKEINRSTFAGRSLAQQFTIQAPGERLGAAKVRSPCAAGPIFV